MKQAPMTPAERTLRVTVMHTVQTAAVITNSIVKAAHGESAQRGFSLDRAITNAEYLVESLKRAKLALDRECPEASSP